MPTQALYTIEANDPIARDVFRMRLAGDTSALTRPGQFVNIRLEGFYLRRPISVCHHWAGGMELIYKVVGGGTRSMAALGPGASLDLLVGLGNGFDIAPAQGKRIALIGGGVGLPPLYGLLKALCAENGQAGRGVHCVMGFQSSADAFYHQDEFKALGAIVHVTTADGSAGRQGLVTDALSDIDYDYYFACGPQAMLRAVHAMGKAGQLSFEERMGCGFGACMGCSCQTLLGHKRICVDGPVFLSGEVAFSC